MSNFMNIMYDGLKKHLVKDTAENLGDRSKYIGASDLNGCIRQKIMDKRTSKELTFQTMLYFMRGHLAENIVKAALDQMKIPYLYQYEMIHPEKPWIKTHLDFVFMNSKRVHILEVKTGEIPSSPTKWSEQLDMQAGLMHMKFPDKEITNKVFALDLTRATTRTFEGDGFYPKGFLEAEKKANLMWDVLNSHTEDNHTMKSGLCGCCNHIQGCPRFPANAEGLIEHPELEPMICEFMESKQMKKCAETTYNDLSEALEQEIAGFGHQKIKAGRYVISIKDKKRTGSVNMKKLEKEQPDTHALVETYRGPDSKYTQLEIDLIPEAETVEPPASAVVE